MLRSLSYKKFVLSTKSVHCPEAPSKTDSFRQKLKNSFFVLNHRILEIGTGCQNLHKINTSVLVCPAPSQLWHSGTDLTS